jgi:hypothetical protein
MKRITLTTVQEVAEVELCGWNKGCGRCKELGKGLREGHAEQNIWTYER